MQLATFQQQSKSHIPSFFWLEIDFKTVMYNISEVSVASSSIFV